MIGRATTAWALSIALLLSEPVRAQAPSGDCKLTDLAALSAWDGVWIAENTQADINGREAPGNPPFGLAMKLLGLEAPWNDTGWTKFEAALRVGIDGTAVQAGWGFPVMMSAPAPFKFIISPAETVIVSQYREIRYIQTDGRPHVPEEDRWPTNWGDSVGCWEGNTLVIDTIGVRYAPEFNPFAPPLSDQAHFVERLRLTAPGRIESDITVTDPETLERPWIVKMVYLRHPVLQRLVHDGDIFQNDRIVIDGALSDIAPVREEQNRTAPIREAARLSEAELDRVAGKYAYDGPPFELTVERRGDRLFERVDPAFPIFLPIYPESPLSYFSRLHGGVFRFTTDPSGKVIGFVGTSPSGAPISGKRLP